MIKFPKLKSDAVMQYPAAKRIEFLNQMVRFLDGSEQRFRGSASGRKSWIVRLDLADESECAALDDFFRSNQGTFGSFSFTDPWDGTEYPDCSIHQDALDVEIRGELRGRTAVVVQENRN